MTSAPPTLLTFGHGALDQDHLATMLTRAEIQAVVDIRRFPGSRVHPHVAREVLEEWLPTHGISYSWEPRLGGRRRLPEGAQSPDTWWTVEAFRAYATHTRTPEFAAALDQVLELSSRRTVAVMCSESVWWRCHRRLVADVALLAHGTPVLHVMAGARMAPHRPAEGVRVQPDGLLIWDGQR